MTNTGSERYENASGISPTSIGLQLVNKFIIFRKKVIAKLIICIKIEKLVKYQIIRMIKTEINKISNIGIIKIDVISEKI